MQVLLYLDQVLILNFTLFIVIYNFTQNTAFVLRHIVTINSVPNIIYQFIIILYTIEGMQVLDNFQLQNSIFLSIAEVKPYIFFILHILYQTLHCHKELFLHNPNVYLIHTHRPWRNQIIFFFIYLVQTSQQYQS